MKTIPYKKYQNVVWVDWEVRLQTLSSFFSPCPPPPPPACWFPWKFIHMKNTPRSNHQIITVHYRFRGWKSHCQMPGASDFSDQASKKISRDLLSIMILKWLFLLNCKCLYFMPLLLRLGLIKKKFKSKASLNCK